MKLLLASFFLLTLPLVHADIRSDFLVIVSRERVPLDPRLEKPSVNGNIEKTEFSYASAPGQRVPAVLHRPADGKKHPAVIALHGTGGNKEGMTGILEKLAAKGFVAISIDAPWHGKRAEGRPGAETYQRKIAQAFADQKSHPFYYDSVWDVMRLVDYLQTRDDVDPKRIGLMGISKGGIETYLTAAIDPRIAAAVPVIGVQSFEWALDNDKWQGRVATVQDAFDDAMKQSGIAKPDAKSAALFYDKVAPGLHGEFDCPAMLALIAPRPLLIVNGDSDDKTPLPGVMEAYESALKAYASAPDHLKLIIQDKAGHEFRPDSEEATLDWFVKWLQP